MEWRDIEGYEGYYQVSNTGLVRAISRTIIFADGRKRNYPEKMLPIKEWFKNGKGYLMVSLTKHHKTKGFSVHRLVANAFIPNPNNYPQVNHKDEDKSNNQRIRNSCDRHHPGGDCNCEVPERCLGHPGLHNRTCLYDAENPATLCHSG